VIGRDVQDHRRADGVPVPRLNGVATPATALPAQGPVAGRLGDHAHLIRHDERAEQADAELADQLDGTGSVRLYNALAQLIRPRPPDRREIVVDLLVGQP